jgi:lipopolysaccharide transport system ATP-binding protein
MGLVIYGTNTHLQQTKLPNIPQHQQLQVVFQLPCLMNKGVYTITVGIHSETGVSYDWVDELIVFEVYNGSSCDGFIDLKSCIKFNLCQNSVNPGKKE